MDEAGEALRRCRSGLASSASRAALLETLGRSDPLIGDALKGILDRGHFHPMLPDDGPDGTLEGDGPAPVETDPAIVTDLMTA